MTGILTASIRMRHMARGRLPPSQSRVPAHPQLSLRRQCALVGVARSGMYYPPVGDRAEDRQLRPVLDAQYTETPFDGVRRMTAWLRRQGYAVNPKHIRRLLRQMEWAAIDPKPRLSQPDLHTISPISYLFHIFHIYHFFNTYIPYKHLPSNYI